MATTEANTMGTSTVSGATKSDAVPACLTNSTKATDASRQDRYGMSLAKTEGKFRCDIRIIELSYNPCVFSKWNSKPEKSLF